MPIKQAFADAVCSPWFPASTNPVRPGWYEARGFRFNGFLHLLWTGREWQYFGPRHTDPSYPSFGAFPKDEWRGITQDEAARPHKRGMPFANITDTRFGLVTAIKPEYLLLNGGMRWRFQCDCGRQFVSNAKWFRAGNSASCGCHRYKRNVIAVERPWLKA
jgi:hypothetical protein